MRVLIDAGHGIDTKGKRSPDESLREWKWVREVANLLIEMLRYHRIDCELVTPEDTDIPLKERVARINKVCNEIGAGNVLMVSIHANAYGYGEWNSAKGWSCYTTKGKTNSDKVAECLYDAFEAEFPDRKMRMDLADGDRDIEENFYIIKNSLCPAVLTENFFYTNREECEFMKLDTTKMRVATATMVGIIDYIYKYRK